MSAKSIEVKLKELGGRNDRKALEAFVDSLEDEKICTLIAYKICHSDAPQLLNYLYQGMSQNGSMEIKRFKLTERVLQELQSWKLQNSQVNAIVSRLCLEVEKLTADHLVQFCEYCIHCIQNDGGEQTSWKDLFPKLLSVLVTSDTVNHSGIDMTGSEYKSEVIRTLLMVKWQPSIVTSLAAMFTEVPLSTEQHLQIVNKLCGNFEQLGPPEIPPLVHQLLQLCKNQHGVVLFLKLQAYFSTRLYNQLGSSTDSENSDMGISLAGERETQFAEATVLFHIHQSATFGHASIKNFLKFMKSVTNAPDLALDPFLLTVLLSLSSISIYEEQVFDILKNTIQRMVQEDERRMESGWLRGVTPDKCNMELVLTKVMENSLRERSTVMEGLVNVAFILLGAIAVKGKESVAEKLWGFGTFVLVRLIRKHHEVTRTVLQLLTDRIITGHAVSQYTNCLYQMALSVPLVLNEYRSIIIRLLEQLAKLPGPVAEDVVYAMLPIVRSFPSLRDVLIMILRKALFSRDVGTRKMAVSGFLQLLKYLDVKGLAILSSQSSQCSQPPHAASVLTQIDMEAGCSSSNNEAICLELLGVLRRCFMQQADVRLRLYEGLYSGVIKNPELSVFVQDILINHFSEFYMSDEDTLPPLNFSKAVILKDVTTELQEPLGHLVFAIQHVVNTAPSDSRPSKLIQVLNSLSGRMIKCSLEDFGLNEETNLLDNLPESQQQQEIVCQILGVFEALMGYTISSWSTETSTEKAQKLNSLFKGYSRLAEFAKNSGKPGKKADGDGGAGTQPRRMNVGKKTPGKGRTTAFKFPHTVLDYHVASRMLSLLHMTSVPWSSAEAMNQVKGRREFNRYAVEVALKLVKTSHDEKRSILKSASVLKLYNNIGSLLYNHCVVRLQEFTEFDLGTAALALECFNELFALICSHHKEKLGLFLEEVGDVPLKEGLAEQLLALASKYEELLTNVLLEEDEAEDEPGAKKIPKLLIHGLTQVSLQIPCNETGTKVLNWVKTFAREKELPNVVLVKGMMTLLFALELRCKGSSQLYDHIAMKLCALVGIIEDGEEVAEKYTSYAMLKAGYESPVLFILCDTVNRMLEHVDWVLQRLRAEYTAMMQSVSGNLERRRELLKSKEQEVVQQMSHCVQILNYVCSLALDPGTMSDAVLKLLARQYASLTVLTKYFILRSTKTAHAFQNARFERVVKLAGKYLSSHIFNLISHIEANQKDKCDKKKKKLDPQLLKMRVLKETRLIPKLVFEMELFEKFVIELSKKSKVDLMSCVKLSVYRDFRIQSNLVQAAIDQDQSLINAANDSAVNETDTQENESSVSKEPPKKKARKE